MDEIYYIYIYNKIKIFFNCSDIIALLLLPLYVT